LLQTGKLSFSRSLTKTVTVRSALKKRRLLLKNGKSVVVISLAPEVISPAQKVVDLSVLSVHKVVDLSDLSVSKVVAPAPNAPREDDPVIGSHNPEKK
jgi:hypothetical protein